MIDGVRSGRREVPEVGGAERLEIGGQIERTISQLHVRTDGKIEELSGTSDTEQAIEQLEDVLHDLELASRLRLSKSQMLDVQCGLCARKGVSSSSRKQCDISQVGLTAWSELGRAGETKESKGRLKVETVGDCGLQVRANVPCSRGASRDG